MRRPVPAGLALVALTAVLSACATRTVPRESDPGELAAVAPMLAVELFLQAANGRDYDRMAGLFGTVEGPVQGDPQDVELRMATIAELLAHERYELVSERLAPGRADPTRRVGVNLTISGELFSDVGFLVVRTPRGRWMVQEIDLEKVAG